MGSKCPDCGVLFAMLDYVIVHLMNYHNYDVQAAVDKVCDFDNV